MYEEVIWLHISGKEMSIQATPIAYNQQSLRSQHSYRPADLSRPSVSPTSDLDGACVDCLADLIGGLAHVGARVLRVAVQNVQSHIAEIVGGAEPGQDTSRSSLSI